MQEASSLWWQAAGLVFSGIIIISVILASLMRLLSRTLHKKPNMLLASSFVAVVFYAVLFGSGTFNLLDTLPFLEIITLTLLAIGIVAFITRLVKMVKLENDRIARRTSPDFLSRGVNKGVS